MESYPAFGEPPLENWLADVVAADGYVLHVAYRVAVEERYEANRCTTPVQLDSRVLDPLS